MSRICKSIETESRSVVLVAGELAITGLKKKVSVAQSCLTFYNSMDYNQPGSSVHGILQVRILEWVAIPFPTQGLDPRIKPRSPTLQGDSLLSESPGKPQEYWSGKPFPSPGNLLWGLGHYWLRGTDFFWDNENLLKLIVVIDAQLCAYPKGHWIEHFKWVNCCVCVCVLKDLSVCCTENRNGSVEGASLEEKFQEGHFS